ncbi:formate dehydrogenase [Streptomyces sp. A7024]|uniref:Formate dehydrogenase n=1 Tax=Streptomyces coryli TaxID=1128680 RepID=A0A6G4UF29_9ACTN|nr:cytochrome b/b6 domain-containing protein [Streptomyces coryli]NGN70415.1 formate dehydrogenase [Streptomyces coryli]
MLQRPERVRRFSAAERWVHRSTAVLMGVCIFTAAVLYVPQLAELAGRRRVVVLVHEWSGILLPVPVLAGLVSRAFRADLRRLNRFGPHDGRWLRAALRRRPEGREAGKFNAGQKVYAAWVAGAGLVMLGTGVLMWFTDLAGLRWRTGATFVHDWLSLGLGLAVAGHVWLALSDPEARRGMRTGRVDAGWARREHPLWESAGDGEAAAGDGRAAVSDGEAAGRTGGPPDRP